MKTETPITPHESTSVASARHTPGPWKVEPAYTGTSRYPISHRVDSCASGILAEVNGQGGTEEQSQANARLIAAAPELLEVCAFFLKWADMQTEKGNDAPYQLKKAMLAAHTKATWGENAEQARAAITSERLEYLRGELRAERISYGKLAELQSLKDFIDPEDVELLQAAGVPEGEDK